MFESPLFSRDNPIKNIHKHQNMLIIDLKEQWSVTIESKKNCILTTLPTDNTFTQVTSLKKK